MKIKMLILGAVTVLAISAGAQDRIYKKNGLILNGKVESVNDSVIVFKDEQGERAIYTSGVEAIKYEFGNVLPINGAIARHYRDDAYVAHTFASRRKINALIDPFLFTYQLGYEQFLDRNFHNSLFAQIGRGTGLNRLIVGNDQKGTTEFVAVFGYRRYTSTLNDLRFFYGLSMQLSTGNKTIMRPGSRYVSGNIYPEYYEYPVRERAEAISLTPNAGIQFMLGKSLAFNSSFGIQVNFAAPVSDAFFNLQGMIGLGYYLPGK